ncbi:peptidase M48 Ste24p [Sphingomonas parva]|uniref:Peptidase M48 Ste24p n=1 Tax=Sphingomonas parva TaxID=2555898 RepID=A0A4Y8ZLF9_9SPHN|nr:M48 family metalloprotease [Sphingomonas parva]TFI56804.1 peptidase M48 Ste24p [Sphingomonas parva]
MTFKTLLALSTALGLAACASGGLTGEGPNRAIAPGAAQQAAQQHPAVVQEFGGAETGAHAAYVTEIGRKVAAQSGIQGAGTGVYTFTTLNSPVMNAFAVPGGYIYVTRQLLGLMNDEAELASVLGHEVGHVAADHSKGRQNRGILSQIGALIVGAATGSSELAQLAGQVGQGLFLSYSRSQEFEADDLGIRYMTAAGYDPNASVSLLASLGASTALEAQAQGRDDERSTPSWARTHPLSADRVERATRQAQATGRAGTGVRNRDVFLGRIDGILVDDDPRQGVIEGRNFLHPDLRLRFTVPNGYGMQNGASAVSIVGQQGQAQFSGGASSGDRSAYIAQVFRSVAGEQAQISIPQPQSTTVNGIPAAYSTARVSTQQGQVDLTVFAYRWDANSAYHFVMITPAGSGLGPFAAMVQSLDRLSASEAAAIRPRVIDVVTVGSGDTVASLAARMAYSDYREERVRVLNGLASGAAVQPGQKVKLVVFGTR